MCLWGCFLYIWNWSNFLSFCCHTTGWRKMLKRPEKAEWNPHIPFGHCSLLVSPAGVPPVWNSDFSFVESEIVRDLLYQLNVHHSMEPDEIHPWVLRKLTNVIAGAISLIHKWSWESGESLLTGHLLVLFQSKKRHEERPRELQKGFSSLSCCKKNMEKMILSTVERHLKNNRISRHSQHGFVKENLF